MTNIQPCFSKVLIQMFEPKGNIVVLPERSQSQIFQGFKIKVLAIGPLVTCCKPGDFLIIRPDPNILPINDKEKIGLVDESVIFAIDLESQTLPS